MKVWRRSASAGLAALLRSEGMTQAWFREDCEAVVCRLSRQPPQAVPAAVQVSWPVWHLRGHCCRCQAERPRGSGSGRRRRTVPACSETCLKAALSLMKSSTTASVYSDDHRTGISQSLSTSSVPLIRLVKDFEETVSQ